jgi:hypothetical protein
MDPHLKWGLITTSDDEGRKEVQQGIKGGNELKEVSYSPSETNVRLGAGGVKTKSSRAFKMGPS